MAAFSVLACLLANGQAESPALRWTAFGILGGGWLVFLLFEWRPSTLSMNADGLFFHRHRIAWDEIASIEPPSARGDIVLRLRRSVPDRFRLAREGSQDWLLLEGTSFAVGPLGLYALLVGTSREASWLLGSADDERD